MKGYKVVAIDTSGKLYSVHYSVAKTEYALLYEPCSKVIAPKGTGLFFFRSLNKAKDFIKYYVPYAKLFECKAEGKIQKINFVARPTSFDIKVFWERWHKHGDTPKMGSLYGIAPAGTYWAEAITLTKEVIWSTTPP